MTSCPVISAEAITRTFQNSRLENQRATFPTLNLFIQPVHLYWAPTVCLFFSYRPKEAQLSRDRKPGCAPAVGSEAQDSPELSFPCLEQGLCLAGLWQELKLTKPAEAFL